MTRWISLAILVHPTTSFSHHSRSGGRDSQSTPIGELLFTMTTTCSFSSAYESGDPIRRRISSFNNGNACCCRIWDDGRRGGRTIWATRWPAAVPPPWNAVTNCNFDVVDTAAIMTTTSWRAHRAGRRGHDIILRRQSTRVTLLVPIKTEVISSK